MKLIYKIILFSWIIFSIQVKAIIVDGIINDKEWQHIKSSNTFTTVSPFSLSTPEYKTEVKVLSNANGIYFAIINHQPKSAQRSKRTARDAHMVADYNNIVLDFDNNSISAYSFTVANGGSIEDGIYRNENDYSYEWNGVWYAQTSSDDEHWYSEIHIPWDVAPMALADNDKREIGFFISRRVAHLSKTYANAPTQYNRQRFMSDFNKVNISDFSTSSLQMFGYASVREDRVNDEFFSDVGVDIFWKPSSNKQLSISLNPDFGHVESDQLVVNFSPTETFFSENRPFFTENQGLFDVRGTESLRLVHTRRIGAKPDIGDSVGADLLGAMKFTSVVNEINYGLFSAFEDGDKLSKGRKFYVGRALTKQEKYSLGYLLTRVDRPDIDRSATVNSLDYSYSFSNHLKLTGQLVQSHVHLTENNHSDTANWLELEHQLDDNWAQSFQFSYYGDEFEPNDLGYLPRNDLSSISYTNSWKNPIVDKASSVKEHRLDFEFERKENTSGLKLVESIVLADTWSWKDASSIMTRITFDNGGYDDLLSRGNNSLEKNSGFKLELLYYGANKETFNYHVQAYLYNQAVSGNGYKIHGHGTYFYSDNYSLDLATWYTRSDEWLVWQQDNDVTSYSRHQLLTSINFNATIDDKQELSFKFEWLALNAKTQKGYRITMDGSLLDSQNKIQDFSLSDTALQLRYRYELAPLSNIYLVYSRGGSAFFEDSDSLNSLFQPGWNEKVGDNFLVKIRYQF
ncbi:DUF5916 domain-containing protein [Aliikangiella sp. G2MR2-5]|uniref:DUF5916 domain-containing protein n=1 Tax=Aliikangiella sp. G2MR2-5 TaxID=2788943 RepID=UPI0018AAF393|nr:DUF5916 domain-containing protein [Aliikangiella sp. G2MR2-5]